MRLKKGRALLKFSRIFYSRENLRAAALILGDRARVLLAAAQGHYRVELSGPAGAAALRAAAGDFLNEALSHAYRQRVVRFNRPLSGPFFSRLFREGFPAVPPDPLEGLEPQVALDRRAETDALLARAKTL